MAVAKATGRRLGGGFLAGAGNRLLPASVPFRWFGAALVCHALAWLALAAGAAHWADWRGGLGWPLAALHLVTLGTLVASAIGASLQLLPVATRRSVRWPRTAALLWWLWLPGLALLVVGMGWPHLPSMAAGAALVLAVLLAWALLLALNLRGARGMLGVVLHGWGAVAALLLLMASAAALVALWNGVLPLPALSRDGLRALHAVAGVLGVMGLLVLGLSTILLPMFALASVPEEREQLRAGAVAIAALTLFAVTSVLPATELRWAALLAAALALALHVRSMRALLARALRADLGRCGVLLRIGWASAAMAVMFGALAIARGTDEPWGALALLAGVGGWLLSTLLGVLQRILPFLASMHAARSAGRRPPTPGALTIDAPLALHLAMHGAALLLLGLAIVTRSPIWLLAAAACGLVGALAFLAFFAVMLQRLRRTTSSAA